MKLVFCRKCQDIFRIWEDSERFCKCGASSGKYIDLYDAFYTGDCAVPVGFANQSFSDALRNQPDTGWV